VRAPLVAHRERRGRIEAAGKQFPDTIRKGLPQAPAGIGKAYGRLQQSPSLALQPCFVNDIDGGRRMVDDLTLFPLAQNSTDVLARHIGQGS
jgi:hypothetical protein